MCLFLNPVKVWKCGRQVRSRRCSQCGGVCCGQSLCSLREKQILFSELVTFQPCHGVISAEIHMYSCPAMWITISSFSRIDSLVLIRCRLSYDNHIGQKLEIVMAKNEIKISKLITLYRFSLFFSVLAVQFLKNLLIFLNFLSP